MVSFTWTITHPGTVEGDADASHEIMLRPHDDVQQSELYWDHHPIMYSEAGITIDQMEDGSLAVVLDWGTLEEEVVDPLLPPESAAARRASDAYRERSRSRAFTTRTSALLEAGAPARGMLRLPLSADGDITGWVRHVTSTKTLVVMCTACAVEKDVEPDSDDGVEEPEPEPEPQRAGEPKPFAGYGQDESDDENGDGGAPSSGPGGDMFSEMPDSSMFKEDAGGLKVRFQHVEGGELKTVPLEQIVLDVAHGSEEYSLGERVVAIDGEESIYRGKVMFNAVVSEAPRDGSLQLTFDGTGDSETWARDKVPATVRKLSSKPDASAEFIAWWHDEQDDPTDAARSHRVWAVGSTSGSRRPTMAGMSHGRGGEEEEAELLFWYAGVLPVNEALNEPLDAELRELLSAAEASLPAHGEVAARPASLSMALGGAMELHDDESSDDGSMSEEEEKEQEEHESCGLVTSPEQLGLMMPPDLENGGGGGADGNSFAEVMAADAARKAKKAKAPKEPKAPKAQRASSFRHADGTVKKDSLIGGGCLILAVFCFMVIMLVLMSASK